MLSHAEGIFTWVHEVRDQACKQIPGDMHRAVSPGSVRSSTKRANRFLVTRGGQSHLDP